MFKSNIHSHKDFTALNNFLVDRGIFHSEDWLKVLANGFGVNVYCLTTEKDGVIVSRSPIFEKCKFGFKICGSPLRGTFTQYMGPLFLSSLTRTEKELVFDSQILFLKNSGYSYIEFGLFSDDDYLSKVLYKRGFKYSRLTTIIIDLSVGVDQVWKGFESRARNMVRKSQKNGVIVSESTINEVQLDNYYEVLSKTFSRQGLKVPHSKLAYKALIKNLAKSSNLIFLTARLNNKFLSGGIFLVDGSRMVFHSGATTPEGNTIAASSLVQWEAIQIACRRGLLVYDLGGVGVKSIDKFKQSFGGEITQHHRWVYKSWLIKSMYPVIFMLTKVGIIKIF